MNSRQIIHGSMINKYYPKEDYRELQKHAVKLRCMEEFLKLLFAEGHPIYTIQAEERQFPSLYPECYGYEVRLTISEVEMINMRMVAHEDLMWEKHKPNESLKNKVKNFVAGVWKKVGKK